MAEPWTPALSIREARGGWRLDLGGQLQVDGATLEEAADELVRRLLAHALCLRSETGFRISPEAPGVDLRWFEFLYELGSIAARGDDIRERVFLHAA